MPCTIRQLTPNSLEAVHFSAESLQDAARYEPTDGVYTISNTYNTLQVLKLDAHLDRMEDSARREGFTLQLDRARLRAALRSMIVEAQYGDVRFRITAPRAQPDHLILSLEPFRGYPAALYERGIKCVTVPGSARHDPAAKTTDWMIEREAYKKNTPPDVGEWLLLDADGAILEGFSSNFYAILDGELRTAGAGMLPGIAQQIVFSVAPPIIPLCRDAVAVDDVPRLSEAFITSSSRGIVPVVEIDGIRIGAGVPGDTTRALQTAYAAWVEAHLEDL
jgi:branched-chain amino acid aminotransferase